MFHSPGSLREKREQAPNNVTKRGNKFIITILPSIIQENKRIHDNREKVLKIKDYLIEFKTLNKNEQKFLKNLASQYNVNIINKHKIDIVEDLLEKVDVIPNSIVLAQAANESGWGTSRFAKEFNAFFGTYIRQEKDDTELFFQKNSPGNIFMYFIRTRTNIFY